MTTSATKGSVLEGSPAGATRSRALPVTLTTGRSRGAQHQRPAAAGARRPAQPGGARSWLRWQAVVGQAGIEPATEGL